MITISLPSENRSTSLVLTHFCETHGPSVVFTTQSEYILPSSSTSVANNCNITSSSSSSSLSSSQLGSSSPSSSSPLLFNDDINNTPNHSHQSQQQQQQHQQQYVHNYTELPELFNSKDENNDLYNNNGKGNNYNYNNSNNSNNNNNGIYLNDQERPLISAKTLSILIPPPNMVDQLSSTMTPTPPSSTISSAPTSPSLSSSSSAINTSTTTTTTASLTSVSSTSSLPSSSSTTTTISAPRCPTCSSLPPFNGLVSQDQLNPNIYYISSHQPSNSSYSQIRNSCVRSLSCELVPGREGPVLVNNNDITFLSYTFKLNDSRARGSARKYGFMVLGESSCLVSYFGWIVNCLRSIASEMQTRANVVFTREQSSQQSNQTAISNMMRRGIRAAPLRPLVDLLEDPRFFERLHRTFSNLLSSCHLKYHLLQNPSPTTEEQDQLLSQLKLEASNRNYVSGSSASSSSQQQQLQLQLQQQDMHARLAEKLKQTFPMSAELVTSLSQVAKIIGENSLSALVFNTIVGNQVIIQGRSPPLVASLIDLLKLLIPKECCSICYYSETFKEIWECNILGLSPNAVIPRHVDRDIIAMVDIDYYDKSKEPEDIDSPYRSTIEISFNGPRYTSTLGLSIESIIKQNSPPEIEKMNLLSLKEEWINKTKTFYSIRSIIVDDKDRKLSRFLQLINCNLEKDITILMFWTTCVRRWYSSLDFKNK